MTREALRAGGISETSIGDALIAARGDLFVASAHLKCSPTELNRYMRQSEGLQGLLAAIGEIKVSPEFKKLSNDQYLDEIDRLRRDFKLEALHVVHELATESAQGMNAKDKDVKLRAALALMGGQEKAVASDQNADVFAELNRLYQEAAPRIRTVRAVQIEYSSGS